MNTTSNLSALMQTYYDDLFLKRVDELKVLDQFGQKRPLPMGEGKVIYFSRYLNLSTATTALTEGTNPTGSNLSAENVSATVAEYGDYVKISGLVSLTALDEGITQRIPILAEQCAATVEELTGNEVYVNGTAQVVSTAANMAAITATDVLTSTDIKKAYRDLQQEKAMKFAGGFYASVLEPYTEYDFFGDSTWVDAKTYSGVTDLYKGEVGKWFGMRFVLTTMPYRSDVDGTANRSSGAVHYTLCMGQEGYGITDLEGERKKVIVHSADSGGTENPLNMYSTAGWKLAYVPKILNANWVRVIQSGATA